jgi:hypothetical protein
MFSVRGDVRAVCDGAVGVGGARGDHVRRVMTHASAHALHAACDLCCARSGLDLVERPLYR